MTPIDRRQARPVTATTTLAFLLAIAALHAPYSATAGPAPAAAQSAKVAAAAKPAPSPAEALLDRYAALRPQLEHSPFGRPLYLESSEGSGAAQGDVFAVIGQPIATVVASLVSPQDWCEALILHLNIKYCHAAQRDGHAVLLVASGKKHEQPLSETYSAEFSFTAGASTPEFLNVELYARQGPLGTRNYRIELQAAPIRGGQTFLHLRYSFGFGFEGELAMSAYLATSGSGKVGFTTVADGDHRTPHPVGGMRGAVERNAMRYYLAIEAYLGSLSAPRPQRFNRSLELWFDATESYATQLHEVDRETYLSMKRHEYQRQQTLQQGPVPRP